MANNHEHPAVAATAAYLRLAQRLDAAEKQIARLELRLAKVERAAKPTKRESAAQFRRRVLAAIGVGQ